MNILFNVVVTFSFLLFLAVCIFDEDVKKETIITQPLPVIKTKVEDTKATIVLLNSGKKNSSVIVSTDKGSSNLEKVGHFVDLKSKDEAPGSLKTMSEEEIKNRFSNALAAAPLQAKSYLLYFNNAHALDEASQQIFIEALTSIEKYAPCTVDVIGHTDTVGSSELNLKVSLTRARVVEKMLKEQKIKVVSLAVKGYGEEDLLVMTKDKVNEMKNRNVEIFIK